MMRGQGEPLPDFMQADGEWIVENHLFLYREANIEMNPTARFTVGSRRIDGTHAIGFDAVQLAAVLKVDVDAVVRANKEGSLIFLGTADVPPSHGGSSATGYGFKIGETEGYLTLEMNHPQGSA